MLHLLQHLQVNFQHQLLVHHHQRKSLQQVIFEFVLNKIRSLGKSYYCHDFNLLLFYFSHIEEQKQEIEDDAEEEKDEDEGEKEEGPEQQQQQEKEDKTILNSQSYGNDVPIININDISINLGSDA